MLFGSVSSVVSSESHHIDQLRRGPRAWNLWRAQNPHVTPNLTGISLSVAERQMGPINGGPINLAEARLRHASLRFATLTNADLTGADLSDTDLREARLIGANLAAHLDGLRKAMLKAAENLEFEEAARIRDEIKRLEAVDLAIHDDPLARQSAIDAEVATSAPRSKAGKGGTRAYRGKSQKRVR